MFALHTPAIGQLSDIDARLYSHLFQCQMVHHAFEEGMVVRRALEEAMRQPGFEDMRTFVGTPTPPPRHYEDWRLSVEHAALANYFLDRLVFSRWPRWIHGLPESEAKMSIRGVRRTWLFAPELTTLSTISPK